MTETKANPPKVSSMPKRPQRKPSVGLPVVTDTKRRDTVKSVMTQLSELDVALAEAEKQEDELVAKYGNLRNHSEDKPLTRMGSIAESKNPASRPSTPTMLPPSTFSMTEREMLILENVAENRRLTQEMLAHYIAKLDGRTAEGEVQKMSQTLRRGAIATLLEKKCLKKISPPRGTSPFFILTELGLAHLDSELPLEEEMLSEKYKHDSVGSFEHKRILNVASAVIQAKTGSLELEGVLESTSNPVVFNPGVQPVITSLRIQSASASVENAVSSDINQFQREASISFLKLSPRKTGQNTWGLPFVRNGEFNLTDMTAEKAESLAECMKHSFNVAVKLNGKDVIRKVSPAFLFNTYTDEGTREATPLVDFVVVQPNVIVRTSNGREELNSGSIAFKVETTQKPIQQIQYELWQILKSNHGFSACYVISASESIKEAFSEAWIALIEAKRIPSAFADWLQFGLHQPLNSATRTPVKHYSSPAPHQSARSWIQG